MNPKIGTVMHTYRRKNMVPNLKQILNAANTQFVRVSEYKVLYGKYGTAVCMPYICDN